LITRLALPVALLGTGFPYFSGALQLLHCYMPAGALLIKSKR